MVDNAVKRTSRTAAKDSEDKDHAAESEGEGQDSRKEEIDRGGGVLTVWLYCIFCFDANRIKFGITASDEHARDCNASTWFGTCFTRYFELPVSQSSPSTLVKSLC
jgi:hypothetical protein